MVNREQFETLMNEDIFDSIQNAEKISGSVRGGTFSDRASWAVWADETDGVGPVKSSNDKSVLASYEVLEDKIHTDVILLALNSGIKFTSDKSESPWSTFHSGGRDYNLARAISDTPMSGAYITDLYKGLPTKSASELKDHLKSLSDDDLFELNDSMRQILERELEILGASKSVPIICLGEDVQKYFDEIFGGSRVAFFANHYSKAMTSEFYSEQMKDVADKIFI